MTDRIHLAVQFLAIAADETLSANKAWITIWKADRTAMNDMTVEEQEVYIYLRAAVVAQLKNRV